MPVLPEIFSDETFYPVAFDRFTDLSGYREAQPGPIVLTGSEVGHNVKGSDSKRKDANLSKPGTVYVLKNL